MKQRLAFALSSAALSAAAVACSPAPSTAPMASATSVATPTSATTTARSWTADVLDGFSFIRPSDWTPYQANEHAPWVGGPLIWLSTDLLLPSCATEPGASPNPPDAQGYACSRPLDGLQPNGVLVAFATSRILAPLPSDGEPVEVDGQTARWRAKPGSCEINADETITVAVPIGQPTPLSNIAVVACLRGPDLASAEADLRTLLESLRLSP